MRRKVMLFLVFLLLAVPQLSQAEPAPDAAKAKILGVRSGPFVDKVVGTDVMRYVFDVSQPVSAEGFVVIGGASPRLAVVIKGAVPADGLKLAVEDEYVKNLGYTVNAAGTQMLLELNKKINANDFRVFTLPGAPQANKMSRVVVDINRNSRTKDDSKAKPASAKGNELLQLRSYTHVDAVTGSSKLRIVLDSVSPVEYTTDLSVSPLPRLVVSIKGAAPGNIVRNYDFDGKIVDRAVIVPGNKPEDSKLVVELPLVVEPGDYKIFALPGDPKANKPFRLVIDLNQKQPQTKFKYSAGLVNKLIVIDPGHGGTDPGAIGKGGLQEKTVNLAVALKTKALLEKAGAKVVMTRDKDVDVYGPDASDVEELKSRTTVANSIKADVFISIHSNSTVNREIGGTSTYFFPKSKYDIMLAQALQQSMLQAGGLADRKIHSSNFFVNKRTIMPSALIELAFLSNNKEEKLLGSPQFQQQMAQGIAAGLEKFFVQASKLGGEE